MRIEYFAKGAIDCPLILIYGDNRTEANVLRQAVIDLADGINTSLAIHNLPGFEAVDQCQVLAVAGLEDIGVRETALSGMFEWTLRPESWVYVADLIKPFCALTEETRIRFQYLDEASTVSVLISTGRSW